jgi:hypothetical protein
MIRRPPRGATEKERLTDINTRTVAILVLAAGGEISVPLEMIDQADFIELEQIDRPGKVIWRARPHRRIAAGPIVDAEATVIEASSRPAQHGQVQRLKRRKEDL